MKQINITRYNGSNHVSLVADKKNNPILMSTVQATSVSEEEAEAQLRKDLSLQVSDELKLEVTDFTKFPKFTTEQLLRLYDKTENMLGAHEMIEAVLIKRGALSIPEAPEEIAETEEETPEKETKAPREYKKCLSEECLQARLAEARKNYKKFCKFLCTKDKEEHFGIIRSARLDKRSGFIQYRIEIIAAPSYNEPYEKTGKVYGKGDDSKDLIIFDTKPEEIDLAEPKAKEEKPAPKEEKPKAEKKPKTSKKGYTKKDAQKMNETIAEA